MTRRREASRRYHGPVLTPDTTTPRAPDLQEHRGARVSEGRHATYEHDCTPLRDDFAAQRACAVRPLLVASFRDRGLGPSAYVFGGDQSARPAWVATREAEATTAEFSR